MFTVPKGMSLPVEGGILTPPSPAISSISSYGSGTVLIHGHQPKAGIKRKPAQVTISRKHAATRITTIIWSALFLVVIVATVIVIAALAENIKKLLWTRVSFSDDGLAFQPGGSPADDSYPKIQQGSEKGCIYRRVTWERGSQHSEIVHDLNSKWSAVVDYDQERCLLFNLPSFQSDGCPKTYPWELDLLVGVPSCRGALARIAPIRKIVYHMCSTPVNLTATGEAISLVCLEHTILHVDRVVIQYYDRKLRRVARDATKPPDEAPESESPPGVWKPIRSTAHLDETPDNFNIPDPNAKSTINSQSISTNTYSPSVGKIDFTEALSTSPRDVEQSRASASAFNGQGVAVPSSSPLPKSSIMPTGTPSIETTHPRDVVTKASGSKLNSVLLKSGNGKFVNKEITLVPKSSVESFWEAVYTPVDEDHDQIIKTQTLRRLKEVSQEMAKVGLERLITL